MTQNQAYIAGITMGTVILAVLAFWNSRTERQNSALFKLTAELKAPRWPAALLLLLGIFASTMAMVVDHGRGDRTWPMALIGMLGMFAGCLMTLPVIRLEANSIRFGLRASKSVAYAEVAELVRVHSGRDVDFFLVLNSGVRVKLGQNIACAKALAEEVQQRTGCKITFNEGGERAPVHH